MTLKRNVESCKQPTMYFLYISIFLTSYHMLCNWKIRSHDALAASMLFTLWSLLFSGQRRCTDSHQALSLHSLNHCSCNTAQHLGSESKNSSYFSIEKCYLILRGYRATINASVEATSQCAFNIFFYIVYNC